MLEPAPHGLHTWAPAAEHGDDELGQAVVGQRLGDGQAVLDPEDPPQEAGGREQGVDADEEKRRQGRAAKLYGLRNYPPEKVAEAVVRAVVRNQAVVPVTPEARGGRFMARFTPRALRALARLEPPL